MKKKETIIISQRITIEYENDESRQRCIYKVLEDTNWYAFVEGMHSKSPDERFGAYKTKLIQLEETNVVD